MKSFPRSENREFSRAARWSDQAVIWPMFVAVCQLELNFYGT